MTVEAVNAAARTTVVSALQKASAATGSDFNYLLKTAVRESGLNANAQASTSSASGLFQFVEQTWLGLVKENGGKYGLGGYASQITKGSDGRYRVSNSADRQAILSLRSDPQTSALMAGEYANQCKNRMESTLGREVSGGELYAAHFLGPVSGAKLVALNGSNPGAVAADAFPQAAAANRSVFYHSDGSAKSVNEVYGWATSQPSTTGVTASAVAAYTASDANTSGMTTAEAMALMSDFETKMMTSALLSDNPDAQDSDKVTGSPFRLSFDVLASLQGVAQKNGNT